MQTYLVQLRAEDEDDGVDRLALAGRHYFLSFVLLLCFFFFLCWIPLLCLLCASSPCSFVLSVFLCIRLFGGEGVPQPETRLMLLHWLADAPLRFCHVFFSSFHVLSALPFLRGLLCFFEKKQGNESPLSISLHSFVSPGSSVLVMENRGRC